MEQLENEILLTEEKIGFIKKEALDPDYKIVNLIHPGRKSTDVMRVSNKTGLILFKGNDDTGFKHIIRRHHPMSKAPYWNVTKEKISLETPTRFGVDTVPIFDLLKIADSIFKPENRNIEKNKSPELFDLFIGPFTDRHGVKVDYRLLLYKGTLIIHTLFPVDKKTYTPKKVLDLQRGFAYCTWFPTLAKYIHTMKYYDSNKVAIAELILVVNIFYKTEKWWLQFTDPADTATTCELLAERALVSTLEGPNRMNSLNHHEDFTEIERWMKIHLGQRKEETAQR